MTGAYDRLSGAGSDRSAVSKDRDRIVHSAALRRLQRKSQIMGAQTSEFVRTRLTHTLECAQIGRAIARRVSIHSSESVVDNPSEFEDLVEAACLAHDLGHPPFGHNGEQALQQAMRTHAESLFEGNAQSFRIVTCLEPKVMGVRPGAERDRSFGLDLCRTTLKAMCKYPWVETGAMLDKEHPKFGIYLAELDSEVFDWLWDNKIGSAKRTVATEILDIADDIAYAVHDFEDGVFSGQVPLFALVDGHEPEITALARKVRERDKKKRFKDASTVEKVLDELTRPLRDTAAAALVDTSDQSKLQIESTPRTWSQRPFSRDHDARANLKNFCAMLIGDFIDDVCRDRRFEQPSDQVRQVLDVLKGMAWLWMIERSDLETKRFAQRRVVEQLFEGYWARPEMLPNQAQWGELCREVGRADLDQVVWPDKARLVCDHIASMTDLYAARVHSEMYDVTQDLLLVM